MAASGTFRMFASAALSLILLSGSVATALPLLDPIYSDSFEVIAPLAAGYPGDQGIANDPHVLFAEMAEQASLAELFANWSANSSANSISLDNGVVPPGSPGTQSIRLFTTGGPPPPAMGPIRTSILRKLILNFTGTTVFARWYVKYNSVGTLHHSGPRLGGNNPAAIFPPPTAGIRPDGSEYFSVGAETTQGKTAPVVHSTLDYYTYWMDMRHNSFFPPSVYYGNTLINDPAVSVDTDAWTCVEVRLTLNEPVSELNGSIAMWVNGIQVSDVRAGTLGVWHEDRFTPTPLGTPFEGFRFRTTSALTFNYFELLHFVDNDPLAGFVNAVNYDHIVVADRYIGPMAPTNQTAR